jgi:hypothetical protein
VACRDLLRDRRLVDQVRVVLVPAGLVLGHLEEVDLRQERDPEGEIVRSTATCRPRDDREPALDQMYRARALVHDQTLHRDPVDVLRLAI